MSHSVLRGNPTASQLYLDTILDAVIKEQYNGKKEKRRDEVNLAEIIYYCMKKNPAFIYMVNGANGESLTNWDILKYAVPLAQAIQSQHKEGRIILFLMKSHQEMAALYYAAIFANVVPLLLDSNSTEYEIKHYIRLVEPYMIFCDFDQYDNVTAASKINGKDSDIKIVIADSENSLRDFAGNYWNLINEDNFQISDASPESTILLIPTSGSTGLPKATVLAHSGLIAQLPSIWTHHERFPKPTKRALLLSSAQWITHTIMMISCPVFVVTLVMTPCKPTTNYILEVIEKFRPTWTLLSPAFLKSLAISCTPDQLSSLETIIATGAPLSQYVLDIFKEKLTSSVNFINGMGTTETHSFITIPAPGTPLHSNGKILNIFFYKIVAEDGRISNVYEKGELCIKSKSCIFRIVPEEVENVISSVTRVQECVVCDSPKGPAAAVVLRPGKQSPNAEKLIHATLSDYKRLRGGVYFVPSLLYTHGGKLNRMECAKLVHNIITKTNKTD